MYHHPILADEIRDSRRVARRLLHAAGVFTKWFFILSGLLFWALFLSAPPAHAGPTLYTELGAVNSSEFREYHPGRKKIIVHEGTLATIEGGIEWNGWSLYALHISDPRINDKGLDLFGLKYRWEWTP